VDLSGAWHNERVTRYRARAVLLLFLLLNLTACQTWQSVSLDAISPAQLIEEDQPDHVRVSGGGVIDLELVSPSVEGDQLVGAGDFSVPLEDIIRLEVRGISIWRSLGAGYLGGLAVAGLVMVIEIVRCGETWAC
jgi:hypothetical protein